MRLIKLKEVMHLTSLGRSTIYKLIADGKFPESVTLVGRHVAWVEEEIENWILEKLAERDEQLAKKQTKLTCAA